MKSEFTYPLLADSELIQNHQSTDKPITIKKEVNGNNLKLTASINVPEMDLSQRKEGL